MVSTTVTHLTGSGSVGGEGAGSSVRWETSGSCVLVAGGCGVSGVVTGDPRAVGGCYRGRYYKQ